MITHIKNSSFLHYKPTEIKLWKGREKYCPLYVCNFNDYAKFNKAEVEIDFELLKSKIAYEYSYRQNLCCLLFLDDKYAFITFPNRKEELTEMFLKENHIINDKNNELMSIEEYIIKTIID